MAAEDRTALSSIKNAARGLDATFQVGGTVKLQKQLRVAWEDLSGSLKQLTFPATAIDLDKLKTDCSPAVFGRGSEEVHDPEYRQALALPGHRFLTSFHPGSTSILADIERLTGYSRVHAEQDKLNLYEHGGFFKSHMDTPSDLEGHFGTLVTCLPCKHTGGDLIIKHGEVTAQTDWAGKSDQDLIQWTAFYSDCLHEIRPVESGSRMTISYKLYASPLETPSPTLEPSSLALQQALSAALKEPLFPPDGRALGFLCSFQYPHTSKQFSRLMLKGPDAVIAAAAESLGLDVSIVPIWPGKDPQDRYHMYKEDSYSSQEEEEAMDPFLTGTPSMLRFKQVNPSLRSAMAAWLHPKAYQLDSCVRGGASCAKPSSGLGHQETWADVTRQGRALAGVNWPKDMFKDWAARSNYERQARNSQRKAWKTLAQGLRSKQRIWGFASRRMAFRPGAASLSAA